MLGKLLKHEFKATSRYFMFLYTAVIGLAIINKIFWLIPTDNVVMNVVRGIVTFAFVIATVATVIFSFVIIIYRFYKSLLSDEGYLSFTLPVTATKHIISKMLVSVMWIIVTVIVVIVSLLIIAINTGFYSAFPGVWELVKQFFELNPEFIKFVVEIIIVLIVGMFSITLMLYTSMSIGHLFTKHRVVASILSYFGLYFIVQIINSIVLAITMTIGFGSEAFKTLESSNDIQFYMLNDNFLSMISAIAITIVVIQCFMAATYFLITRYILSKKLNLE